MTHPWKDPGIQTPLKEPVFCSLFPTESKIQNLIALISIGKVRIYMYIRIYVTLSGDRVFYICHNNPGHLCGKIRVAAGKKWQDRLFACLL